MESDGKLALRLLHGDLLGFLLLLQGGHQRGGGEEERGAGLLRTPSSSQAVQVAQVLAVVYGILEKHLGHLEECES
jgi:hypothetical protein